MHLLLSLNNNNRDRCESDKCDCDKCESVKGKMKIM